MRSICLMIVGLLVVSLVSGGFGFWVKRPNNTSTGQPSFGSEGYAPVTMDSNYGVWVELPQVNIDVSPHIAPPFQSGQTSSPENALPERQAQSEIQRQNFTQYSDASSDLEYELRLYKGNITYGSLDANGNYVSQTKDTNYIANVLKISGRYEYFPDETKSYGFRFYNEHVAGFDYMNTFNASGVYKKYWGNYEAGATVYIDFESGFSGGLIFGPTLHFLYKHYFGASKMTAGAFGGYSYCTLKKFGGLDRNFLTYGAIGAFSMPFSQKVAGSAEIYLSHEYFVGGLQVPYYLSNNIQLVGGIKKAFVFQEWNLSNYAFTIGASRRF